jgi:hypothetical protein
MLSKTKNNFTQALTKSNLFTTKILISSIHMISRIGNTPFSIDMINSIGNTNHRIGNTPFSIHYTIPFGGGKIEKIIV